jgi:hypothetical protein
VLTAFKIALTETQGDGVPKLCFTSQPAAAFAVKAWLARTHDGNVAKGKFEGERVGVEVGPGVYLGAAFKDESIDTQFGEARGEGPATRAGTDYNNIVQLLWH